MPLTYATANKFWNAYLRGAALAPPATLYFGYSTTAPNPDGTGVSEPSGNGYDRLGVLSSTANWTASSGGISHNNLELVFPQPSGPQGHVTHGVVFDAPYPGGTLVSYEQLIEPRDPDEVSLPVKYRIGDFRWKFPVT